MKLSLSWIKDFVNIPEDMDMKQLAYDLTMDTVEVEDVEYLADRFDHMVVGVIEDIEPHPNADKLRVCKVDIGDGEIKNIVCGGTVPTRMSSFSNSSKAMVGLIGLAL